MKRIGTDAKNVPLYELSTNPVVVNAIRRTMLQNVPTFAFDTENIVVTRMKSAIYDADYIRLRISNMPVVEGPTEEEFRKFLEENQDWVLNNDPEGLTTEIKGITMSCAIHHTKGGDDILNVTTDMCTFTKDGKPIKNPYPTPILICKLKKEESIDFSATATLNIPHQSAIFHPVYRCYFTEESGDKHHMRIASRTNIDEDILLRRAVEIIRMRIDHFLGIIGSENTETGGKIVFPFDRFTLPQLFTDYIQDHPAVDYAGYKCDHLLGTQGTIFYRANAPLSLIMSEVAKRIHEDLDELQGSAKKKPPRKPATKSRKRA